MTDIELKELRERNECRAREAITNLGSRYVCHPANAPSRLEPRRSLLVASQLSSRGAA